MRLLQQAGAIRLLVLVVIRSAGSGPMMPEDEQDRNHGMLAARSGVARNDAGGAPDLVR